MAKWGEARRAQRSFGTFCDSNGSFLLQDILAGTYELVIKLLDSGFDSVSPRQPYDPAPEIGSIVREVIVPTLQRGKPAMPWISDTWNCFPARTAPQRTERTLRARDDGARHGRMLEEPKSI